MMDNLKIKICTLEEVSPVRSSKRSKLMAAIGGQHTMGLLRAAAGGLDAKVHLQDVR